MMLRPLTVILVASLAAPVAAGPQAVIDPAAALAQSQATGRPVLAIAGSTGCVYCKKMAGELATDPTVQDAANKFVVLLLDTDDPVRWPRWNSRYKVDGNGIPKVFVVRADGEQIYAGTGAPSDLNAFLLRQLEKAGAVLDATALQELTNAARDLSRGWRRRDPKQTIAELKKRHDPENYSAPARQIAQVLDQMKQFVADRAAAAEQDLRDIDRSPDKAFEAALSLFALERDYAELPEVGEELASQVEAFEMDRVTAGVFEQAKAVFEAEALFEADKRKEAIAALDAVIGKYADTPAADYASRTLTRWRKQDRSAATVAAKDSPATSDASAEQAAVQLRLGKLMLSRDRDKARKYFERAIELAPESPAATEAKQLLDE